MIDTVELVLGGAVPFKGRMDLTAVRDAGVNLQWGWISANEKDGKASESSSIDLETGEFEFDSLKPGSYVLSAWAGGLQAEPIEVELGRDGTTTLEIVFVPQAE